MFFMREDFFNNLQKVSDDFNIRICFFYIFSYFVLILKPSLTWCAHASSD